MSFVVSYPMSIKDKIDPNEVTLYINEVLEENKSDENIEYVPDLTKVKGLI